MLEDWAKFAGFSAFLIFALVGSLLWALNYPPQDAEWICKTKSSAHTPHHERERILSCKKDRFEKLDNSLETANENRHQNGDDGIKITDKLLAIFTGLLVLVGAFQAYYLWGTVEATRHSAAAALRQANAMIAAEGPIFSVLQLKLVGYENERSSVPTIDPVPPGLPPPFCRPLIAIENRGRTEMTINRIFCDWIVAPTVEETPRYHFEEIWNGALPKDQSVWFASQNGIRLDEEQVRTLDDYGAFLWIYGKFIYTDFMGAKFEHGYIARWTRGGGFVRDPLAMNTNER
jgi:hypothetical protein